MSEVAPVSVVFGHQIGHRPVEEINWLWKPYLAYGAVSILDGDPGIGKSLITIDIAARLGTGRPMPDGSPPARNPFPEVMPYTLFVSGDDHVSRTIVPRILAAGGNVRSAIFMGGVVEGDLSYRPMRFPYDLTQLAGFTAPQLGMGGAFVVIDPISALYPQAVATVDSVVRRAIDPLVRMAAQSQSCILLVRHLNKSGGRRSLYRGGGSVGVVGACRTALLAGIHPDDPNRRVLSMTKSNLDKAGPSLTYRVETVPAGTAMIRYMPGERHPETGAELTEPLELERAIPSGPRIVWDGPTTITADDIVATKPDMAPQTARAVEWLRQLLGNGPVPAATVEAQAQVEEIGYRTLCSAKVLLKVQSRKVGPTGRCYWEWYLPGTARPPAHELS